MKSEPPTNLEGLVLKLLHLGQGCGTEQVVARYSISGAKNLFLHFVHLNNVVPLNMVLWF